MSFRGFDPYLVNRVDRSEGARFYLTEDTLRAHDAYGGTSGVLRSRYDSDPRRLHVIVESVRQDMEHDREYRVVAFLFTDQGPAKRERVTVTRVANATSTRHADAALRRYLVDVASKMDGGMSLDDAVRECVEVTA